MTENIVCETSIHVEEPMMQFEETLHYLFGKRILLCEEHITDNVVGRLRVQFINLNLLNNNQPIRFYIDTRDGDPIEVLQLISTMRTIDAPIIGLADGRCEILGLALLQTCDTKLSTKYCHFSLQKVSSSASFRTDRTDVHQKLSEYAHYLQAAQDEIEAVIIGCDEKSPMRKQLLHGWYENKNGFWGKDAVDMHFVDTIVDSEGFWKGADIALPGHIGFR